MNLTLKEIGDATKKITERMQFKLNQNKHKECSVMNPENKGRSWSQCSIDWLLFRLRQEVMVKNEAADVANFAMFIFNNIDLNKTPPIDKKP